MRIRWCSAAVMLMLTLSACHAVQDSPSTETSPASADMQETAYSAGTTVLSDTKISETASAASDTVKETAAITETTISDTDASGQAVTSSDPRTGPQETGVSETAVTSGTPAASETSRAETAAVSSAVTTALTLQFESPYEPYGQELSPQVDGSSRSTVNFSEQKGFWITYLEYASILKNKTESSFRSSIEEYFGNIADMGFNTVYVQVRAFGDAYYDSELFPSGEQYNGTIGSGSSFDALSVMTEAAHKKGLSIHAWVNPMRLMTSSQLEGISSKFPIKQWYDNEETRGKYIVMYENRWYLDPAYDEVTDLIADGIAEIVRNYSVDGIQIDDYFYPTSDAGFDSEAYAASGTNLSLSEWRISNVNKMVKKLYGAVHSANTEAVFGISPQGSIENDYSEAYADVRRWCSESGYCDYILPQVYFGFDNAALPYADVISEWSGMVKAPGVKLVIGLAAYKIGAVDTYAGASGKNEWLDNSDIISRQMALAKTLGNYGGVALYRYGSVFEPSADTAEAVSKEIENIGK